MKILYDINNNLNQNNFSNYKELTNASYYSDGDDEPNNDGRQESDQKDHQGPKPCNTQAKNEIWVVDNHIHKIY